MKVELRQLRTNDGEDVYRFLQALPMDENGFMNYCSGKSIEDFKKWLVRCDEVAKGIGLQDWMVPQSVYWLYIDNTLIGMGKIRHFLTDKLRSEGGHIGYSIHPDYRNRGYGKLLLKLLVEQAKNLGIERVLLTINKQNSFSIKTALANGGEIENSNELRHFIWINC